MAETKLQYKCEKHGVQGGGILLNMTLPDGAVHALNFCLVCYAEFLSKGGVCLMQPVLMQVEEAKTESDFPPMDLGE